MTDLSQSYSPVVCPLCGAQLRRLVGNGRLGAHRRGDREAQCPARGWRAAYVQDLLERDDVADVEAALRTGTTRELTR